MDRPHKLALPLLLLALCAAYANSFDNGFHFDDAHTVVDNPAIRSLRNVPRFFTDAATFSVLPPNRTYRPIVSTTLALDYALGGGYVPRWFHIPTFVLFLLLVLLLYRLFHLILDVTTASPANAWLSLVAAAWFGLHPAMAETVNYIIQRGDLYGTLGCVAALVVYARWPRLRRSGLYLLPFAFALLSKPPAAVFPLLLFFYIYFFETTGPAPSRRGLNALTAALPATVLAAALLTLQAAMTPKTFLPSLLSPWQYRLTQPFVWLRYAAELFLPLHLNVDSDLQPFTTLNLRALAGLAFVLAMLAVLTVTARRRQLYPIAFGLLWFVITQLPTSLYPLSELENDHRMFFSFPGLLLAAVWSAWLLGKRLPAAWRAPSTRPAWIALCLLILSAYAWGVHTRNRVWHDDASLWLDDVHKSPHNGRGLMNYALTQMQAGDLPLALDYFNRALAFTPNYATLEINLGIVNGALADRQDPTQPAPTAPAAEPHFQRAIALSPDDDQAHAFYGRWLAQHGRTADAIPQLQLAVQLNPQRLLQHELLISALSSAGNLAAARDAAQQTLSMAPADTVALRFLAQPPPNSTPNSTPKSAPNSAPESAALWIDRSLWLNRAGQFQSSIAAARHALALDPRSPEAWNNIAAGEQSLHHWDAAIAAAQQAIALRPDFQLARNNLAWSLQQRSLEHSHR